MSAGEVDLGANKKKQTRAQVVVKVSEFRASNQSPDLLSSDEGSPTNGGRSHL
jgi:hypothetical protein